MDKGFELMIPQKKEESDQSIINHEFTLNLFGLEFKLGFQINKPTE